MAPGISSIATKYVGKTLQQASHRLGRLRLAGAIPNASVRFALAGTGLAAVASLFAWRAPGENILPAAALMTALALDAAAALALAAVADRRGIEPRLADLPSLVLSLGGAGGLGAGLLIGALMLRPDAFPILATAFAGLVAMSAFARLALARIVLRLDEADPDNP